MIKTHNQSITLQLPQTASQHALRNPLQAPPYFSVTQFPRAPQGMNDTQRPAISRMGKHFALESVVLGAERIARGLGPADHLFFTHFVMRYHACAFF